MWSEDRIRGAENESSPIKDYSLHAPGRSGSWCTAVTLTHKAAQNGHVCEMRDKKRVLLLSALHSFTHTHTHTQAASVLYFFPSVYLLIPSLLFSSHLLLVCFSLSLFPFGSVWYSSFTSFFLTLLYLSTIFIFISYTQIVSGPTRDARNWIFIYLLIMLTQVTGKKL